VATIRVNGGEERHDRGDGDNTVRGDMGDPGGARMLIATTETITDQRIVTTVGLVLGLAVRARGLGGNIMAGLHALGNGSALDEFRIDLAVARQEALARMEAHAAERGANAIVGVRFDTAEVGHDMSEIVAYGTAVIIERAA
jgi:uncharacterized protein YbjQ (UPF0145 family)